MKIRPFLPLICSGLLIFWLSACDPMFQETMLLQFDHRPRSEDMTVAVQNKKDVSDILDRVAERWRMQTQPITDTYLKQGFVKIYTLSYARYAEHGMYSHFSLLVKELPDSSGFEIRMSEFVASKESDIARNIRLDLTKELRARFGDAAVQMKQH